MSSLSQCQLPRKETQVLANSGYWNENAQQELDMSSPRIWEPQGSSHGTQEPPAEAPSGHMSIFWSPNAILRKKLAVCSHNQIRLCPGLFAMEERQTPAHRAIRGPQED